MNMRILMGLFLSAIAVHGCSDTETPAPADKPVARTTFYPTTYFASRIAGDLVEISCPLPPDADPITWMPDAETISVYQRADLVIVNGADFEKWVAKVSLPPSKVVDTAASFSDKFVRFKTAITHSHGPGGEHDHTGLDGHTWLDPQNAKLQATEIRKALVSLLPDHADKLNANYAKLASDLDILDAQLKQLTEKLKDKSLLASHPAYNYLAKRYKWSITNLDLDPDATPSDEAISEIRTQMERIQPRPRIILWESKPSDKASVRLKKDLGLDSVVFSPCEQAPGAPDDYHSAMRRNIERLQTALSAPE